MQRERRNHSCENTLDRVSEGFLLFAERGKRMYHSIRMIILYNNRIFH